MAKRFKSLLLVFIACLASSSSMAEAPVVISVDEGNPPFMYSWEGKAAGIYPAVIAAAMGRAGIDVVLQTRPWKRALNEMEQGKAGVGGIYKTDERLLKYDFSVPIRLENVAVYFNRASPVNCETLAGLNGKRVGVLLGWSYGDRFDEARKSGKFLVEGVSNDRANLLKLTAGRLDAVLSIEESASAVIATERLSNLDQCQTYLAPNPAYLAFAKQAKRADLLDRFNKSIDAMKQDGSLEKIVLQELAR